MQYIGICIIAYLAFNFGISLPSLTVGLVVMALANFLGAGVTATWFRKELQGWPKIGRALMGSLGIGLIVLGLINSHDGLPIALSVEAVYNGLAISSWPVFLLLTWRWPGRFGNRPNWFDLGCHLAMAGLVFTRFYLYPGSFELTAIKLVWIGVAIAGYLCFNISIKLAGGHRPTTILMNLGGGFLLTALAVYKGQFTLNIGWDGFGAALLGGIAIFGIVWSLGKCYGHFGPKGQGPLVIPLVYDGLLVFAPVLSLFAGDKVTPTYGVAVGLGMIFITYLRYWYHTRKRD